MFVARYPCQGAPWGCLNIYDWKGQYLKIFRCLFASPLPLFKYMSVVLGIMALIDIYTLELLRNILHGIQLPVKLNQIGVMVPYKPM